MRNLSIEEIKKAIDMLIIPSVQLDQYEAGWNSALGTLRDDLRGIARSRPDRKQDV